MLKRIRFQQTVAAAALACLMLPQVASAGGKNGGGNNGGMSRSLSRSSASSSAKTFSPMKSMTVRSNTSVFTNKVGKVSSNNLSSNVLKSSKFTPSGNFKKLGQVHNSQVLIPQSKLGNVVKPNDFKLKERSVSVFTPGKIIDVNGKGPLNPTKLPPIFETGGKGPILDPTKIPPVFDPGNGGGKGPIFDPGKIPPILDPGTGGGGGGPTPPPPGGNGNGGNGNGGNCPPKDNCHNHHCNYPWPIFLGGNYWNGYCQNPYYGNYGYHPSAPQVVTQTVAVDATPAGVQPVAATGNLGDLILEDVIFAEPATALVGPAYRVKFRNQGLHPVAKFRIGLLAGQDAKVNDQSPSAMFEVDGLAGGQAGEVTIRLPRSAMQLVNSQGQSSAFTHLLVAVDVDGNVPEADKTNNVAMLERASLETAK